MSNDKVWVTLHMVGIDNIYIPCDDKATATQYVNVAQSCMLMGEPMTVEADNGKCVVNPLHLAAATYGDLKRPSLL